MLSSSVLCVIATMAIQLYTWTLVTAVVVVVSVLVYVAVVLAYSSFVWSESFGVIALQFVNIQTWMLLLLMVLLLLWLLLLL